MPYVNGNGYGSVHMPGLHHGAGVTSRYNNVNGAGFKYTMFDAARLASGVRGIAEIMGGP